MDLLYEYLVLSLIPIWFISYAVFRMKRHWSDGKDSFILLNKHVYFKWFLTFMMSLLTLFHIMDLALFAPMDNLSVISRSTFFSLLLIAWLVSFFLAIFENNNRLEMQWRGHRSFWPANLVIHIILLVDELIYFSRMNFLNYWTIGILCCYGLQVVFCLILNIYAIIRPNEFVTIDGFESLIKKSENRQTITNYPHGDALDYPKISIKSYKIKAERNRHVIYFTIISTIKSESFVSKKNLNDFERIYKLINLYFPQNVFPNLYIPEFPNVNQYSNEERMKYLAEFLNCLSCAEFMINEFLEFLNINGICRDILSKNHEDTIQKEQSVNITELRSKSIVERYFNPHSQDLHNDIEEEISENSFKIYSDVKILKWVEVDDHIEYNITSKVIFLNETGTIQKRYNEILEFYKLLSKIVGQARLPKFPSKSYLKRSKQSDEKSLNIRKSQLEKFFNHVLNDPAFICNECFEFLNIKTTSEKIYEYKQQNFEIKLQSPITCQLMLDEEGHHLVYTLKFIRYLEGIKKNEWVINRRYREFDEFHTFLCKRALSPLLCRFHEIFNIKEFSLPNIPPKSITPLVSPSEIENRRCGLEKYIEELLSTPSVMQAYCFREFINEPDTSEGFIIN